MLGTALFWAITQREVVISYRLLSTIYRSRNVDNKLPLLTASYLKTAQFSSTSRRKPEIKVNSFVHYHQFYCSVKKGAFYCPVTNGEEGLFFLSDRTELCVRGNVVL
jgi:hypothetical protein